MAALSIINLQITIRQIFAEKRKHQSGNGFSSFIEIKVLR